MNGGPSGPGGADGAEAVPLFALPPEPAAASMPDASAGPPADTRVEPSTPLRYARVWVEVEPYHLDRAFDYAIPQDLPVRPGCRVMVSFNGRRRRGLVVDVTDTTEADPRRVRPVARLLGEHVWLDEHERSLLSWAAARWGAPRADVLRHALPDRVIDVERRAAAAGWFPGPAPRTPAGPLPRAAPIFAPDHGEEGERVDAALDDPRSAGDRWYWRPLPDADVADLLGRAIATTVARGRDAIVVVPDVGARRASRLVERLGAHGVPAEAIVDARGSQKARAAYRDWLRARTGAGRVVIGERRVAFWPVQSLGLAVVLDESNPALKERRSPRHHAREVLLERARRTHAVALLVGTVPSAPAWRLLSEQRVRPLIASRDQERRRAPLVVAPETQGRPRTRLYAESTAAIKDALAAGGYAAVLAVRRGEGRALVCKGCGERLVCPRCKAGPVPDGHRLGCEGCGWSGRRDQRCRSCNERSWVPLAAGAQRLAAELRRALPEATVAPLEGYDVAVPPAPAVLVLTRGSVMDLPPGDVRAVVLPDFDALLRRPGLDAAEDALRLAMRLADWTVLGPAAGGEPPGHVAPAIASDAAAAARRMDRRVVCQTRDPAHHAVRALVARDPGAFWRAEVPIRGELRFPPVAHAIRLDVPGDGEAEADAIEEVLPDADRLLGPFAGENGPGGRRSTLLLKSQDRVATIVALHPLRTAWSTAGADVRVDVDPVDVG